MFLGLMGGEAGAGGAQAAGSDSEITPVRAYTPNFLTREEEEAGWRLLFNGTDLSGWRLRDTSAAPTNWAVRDSALAYGGNGSTTILSTEAYGDFELNLDWRLGIGDDAGVFLRVWNEKEIVSHVSPEVQLVDNLWNTAGMEPKQSAGACTHLYAPSSDATKSLGQWNHLRVQAVGGKVTHWINDRKVVEYEIGGEDWKNRLARSPLKAYPDLGSGDRGHIALQQSSATVRFRNVKVRPLGIAISIARRSARASASPGFRAADPGFQRITLFQAALGGPRDARGRSIAFERAGR